MQWHPLTPEHIFDDNTLEIASDGEIVCIRDSTWKEDILCIPIRNMGGIFAGREVGVDPECRSGNGSGRMSAAESFVSRVLRAIEGRWEGGE